VAREYERQAADPSYAKASEATLAGCIADYFDELQRRAVSPATLSKETTKAGHFVRLWPEDLPMTAVTAHKVYEYIRRREQEGVSRHTVKMELETLRRILKVARHHGLFHVPLEQVLPVKYGSGHKPRTRAPSPEEVSKILSQLTTQRGAHVAFITATGARLGESIRARRKDFDPERRVVFLRGTKTETAQRDVPVTRLTWGLLSFALRYAPGRDVLFLPWGKLHRDLEVACRNAGIAKVTPNDLRRAFATWHRKVGAHPSELAVMLGHTTSAMAERVYGRVSGEDIGKLLVERTTVSPVYRTGGSDENNGDPPDDETPIKTSAPGKSRTCDQRFRNATAKHNDSITELPTYKKAHTPLCTSGVPTPNWVSEAAWTLLSLAENRLEVVAE